MPEPRYRGESWQASIIRANLEAADAERLAEAERAEREAKRARAARRRPSTTPPAPQPADPPKPRLALGWRDMTPEALHRF